MARPARIEDPGLWHHLTNRSRGRRRLFLDDSDREHFFELLGECGRRWDVWTLAACVMSNHYQLLVADERGSLSRAMRHLDGVYTQSFNRRHRRSGPVMRDRYRSRVVQPRPWGLELVRFIHAAPLRARLASRAGEFSWSSHRHYLASDRPRWLKRKSVFQLLGEPREGAAERLDALVHAPISTEILKQLAPPSWTAALGDEQFVREIRRRLKEGERKGATSEGGEGDRRAELVIATACHVFEMTREELVTGRRGTTNIPRLVTLMVCRDTTPASARAIGELFKISPSTVAVLAGRARALVESDAGFEQAAERLMGGADHRPPRRGS